MPENSSSNPYLVELDFEEIVEITVDIKGFLTTPPQNLKAMLPTYTVTTGTCEWEDCYEECSPYTGECYEVCEDSVIWG